MTETELLRERLIQRIGFHMLHGGVERPNADSLRRLQGALEALPASDPLWLRYGNIYSGKTARETVDLLALESTQLYGFNADCDARRFLADYINELGDVP